MPPVIRISDENYDKLKLLVDDPFGGATPNTVVGRLLDAVLRSERTLSHNGRNAAAPPVPVRTLDPEAPGELKHTSVRRVTIDGRDIPKANWNQLLREVHMRAAEELGSPEVIRISEANVRAGEFTEGGYYHLAAVDLSVQGQDSNNCWRSSYRLAERLNVPISVELRWRNKDGAAYPGELGKLSFDARLYLVEPVGGEWSLRRQGVDAPMESAPTLDEARESALGRLRGFAPCNLRMLADPYEEWRLRHMDADWHQIT